MAPARFDDSSLLQSVATPPYHCRMAIPLAEYSMALTPARDLPGSSSFVDWHEMAGKGTEIRKFLCRDILSGDIQP